MGNADEKFLKRDTRYMSELPVSKQGRNFSQYHFQGQVLQVRIVNWLWLRCWICLKELQTLVDFEKVEAVLGQQDHHGRGVTVHLNGMFD